MVNAITAVGTLASVVGDGTSTLPVSPGAIGNCFVLATVVGDTGVTVASVSGGGVTTWARIAGPFDGGSDFELWLGPVTSTGSSTISITGSGTITGKRLTAQEFAGGGAGTVWARDGSQQGGLSNGTSTSVTFATLTPGGASRCYVGNSLVQNSGLTTGGTAGYTVQLGAFGDPYVYNTSVSTAQSPVALQDVAGFSITIAALITASSPSGAAPPYPGLLSARLRPYFG
jgi:hypothetical protein